MLRTSLSLSALSVVLWYRNLLAVEDSFRASKSFLTTRPVFHRNDAAIRGHIGFTFFALVLRQELLDRLAARDGKPPEWRSMVDDLLDLSSVEVGQDGRRALLHTAQGPMIGSMCRALGITLPPVFQEFPLAGAEPIQKLKLRCPRKSVT